MFLRDDISSFFVKRIVKGDNIKTRKVFKYFSLANYHIAIIGK